MTLLFAQYYDQTMMDGRSGGWGFGMMLASMVFVVAVVIGAMYLFRGNGTQHHNDPLDIVKERYAKGDITKEEFEQIKKDLR